MKLEKNVNRDHLLPYIIFTLIIFIAFCCSIFIFDVDVTNLPLKDLLMKIVFVEGHALDKNAVFYYGVGTNNAGRWLTLTDQQATQGVSITPVSGGGPNGLAVFITNSSFNQGAKYVLNANYTIRTFSRYLLTDNWLSVGTWSNSGDTVGTSTVIINSQVSCGTNCYESNVTFAGEWTQPWNTSAIIAFSKWDQVNLPSYFKLNTFTTTKVADNSDVVNSVNQNTNLIINNNNQNTQEIIDSQQETTDAINDLNNNITDSTVGNSHGAGIINQIQFFNDNTLSSVITAPINWINSITNTCSPVSFTLFNQTITLPCGDTLFWNRNDVSTFRVFWNAFFGGLIIYRLLYKLFKTITDALDPTKNELGGITL